MSARPLPDSPNLRFLRKEAKALRRSVLDSDTDSLGLMRQHLPRLADHSDQQIAAAGLSLQKVQHVLARSYGFDDWSALVNHVEPRFIGLTLADLPKMARRDAQLVLREADRRDVVRSLGGIDASLSDAIIELLSPRMRNWIRGDWEMEEAITDEMIADSTRRVCETMRGLAAEGSITWPPDESRADADEPTMAPRLLELAGRRPEELTEEEIAQLMCGLAEWVQAQGWVACEEFAAAAVGSLGEGVRLAIDGTEAPLVQDILETQEIPRMHRLRTLYALMIEAGMCIISGDNPRIVAYKLEVIYRDSGVASEAMDLPAPLIESAMLDALQSDLEGHRWKERSYDDMKDFFVRTSIVSRREGVGAIAALSDHADDAVLKLCLGLLGDVERGELLPDAWLARVEEAVAPVVEGVAHAQRMVIDGLLAVQQGNSPQEVEQTVRSVPQVPMREIRGARW